MLMCAGACVCVRMCRRVCVCVRAHVCVHTCAVYVFRVRIVSLDNILRLIVTFIIIICSCTRKKLSVEDVYLCLKKLSVEGIYL